ncbi:MAG TPA: lipoyl(octanoyl) transferase LipB [Candidatus Binataceae bacterium]|nr:lipoyl(octanoyl) transferase LipB [Candidatus Binataceae bacterium]
MVRTPAATAASSPSGQPREPSRGRTLRVARLGVLDYAAALDRQYALVEARLRERVPDTLLLLEHPHVYTLGRGADERFILDRRGNVPLHRVSRGGQVTYHGPGQLVGYPILRLEGAARDVLRYLRNLEQVMIDALADCGISAGRRTGLTGVWVGDAKIASIGVGLRRWVTLHGFALNVSTDLRYFDRIVPCGIEGCRMTSIAALGRSAISVEAFAAMITRAFAAVFGYDRLEEVGAEDLSRTLQDASAAPAAA